MYEDNWDFEKTEYSTRNQFFSTTKSQKIRPQNFLKKSSLAEIPSYNNEIIDSETPYKKRRNEPGESTKNFYNLAILTEKIIKKLFISKIVSRRCKII